MKYVMPPDERPYRLASAPGEDVTLTGTDRRRTFRQIGWHGASGAFYRLGEKPELHEPGSFGPLWLEVDSRPIEKPETLPYPTGLADIRAFGAALGFLAGQAHNAAEAFQNAFDMAIRTLMGRPAARPTIVCLCGSTRFIDAFRAANLSETLAGRIVLSIGCDMRSDADLFANRTAEDLAEIKADLDELHKRKIDLADEILVLNVGGYVGDSTRSEIDYAQALGKPIRWLEPAAGQPAEPATDEQLVDPQALAREVGQRAAAAADAVAQRHREAGFGRGLYRPATDEPDQRDRTCAQCGDAVALVGDTWYHDDPDSREDHDATPADERDALDEASTNLLADEGAENRCAYCGDAIVRIKGAWVHDDDHYNGDHDAIPANLAAPH